MALTPEQTRDEIIAMARDAGFTANCGHTDRDGTHHPAINALNASVPVQWLERFAALVAAKEREACAQVCEENQEESLDIARGALVTEQGEAIHQAMAFGAANCLSAIRARSTT